MPLALRREAHAPRPLADVPRIIDFPRDVQPILDRRCLGCHNRQKRAAGMNLSGDRSTWASHGYLHLLKATRGLGDNALTVAPYEAGAAQTRLNAVLSGEHHDGRLTAAEAETLRLWVNTGHQFAGTYAALDTGSVAVPGISAIGYAHEPKVDFDIPVVRSRCDACHLIGSGNRTRRTFLKQENINLTHPEWSRVVRAPLARAAGGLGACTTDDGKPVFASVEDPGYRELLARVREVAAALESNPRFSMRGFRLGPDYVREMRRYGVLADDFDPNASPFDPYAIDQAYFELFYPDGGPEMRETAE
jgi:hypothetical protein